MLHDGTCDCQSESRPFAVATANRIRSVKSVRRVTDIARGGLPTITAWMVRCSRTSVMLSGTSTRREMTGVIHLSSTRSSSERTSPMRSTAAHIGAFLAVAHGMFCTLLAAPYTDFCAQAKNLLHGLASARHCRGGQSEDRRTIDVQRDAAGHRLGVLLLETGRGTMVAGCCAIVAGLNARRILFVGHGGLLKSGIGRPISTAGDGSKARSRRTATGAARGPYEALSCLIRMGKPSSMVK